MVELPSFSYSVGRPFPFRYFTIFVWIEFAIALVVISIVNYASSGYYLVSEYHTDPNVTESQTIIPGIPTLLTTKAKPICQHATIPVGTTISTNNTALTYLLTGVQHENKQAATSLIYHNNFLDDCAVSDILMSISSVDRMPAQASAYVYGIDVAATVSCSIYLEDEGKTTFNLTAQYNYLPPTVSIYDGLRTFGKSDEKNQTSLYWADVTLAHFWADLAFEFDTFPNSTKIWGDGGRTKAVLYLNSSRNATEDMTLTSYYEGLNRILTVQSDGNIFWMYLLQSMDTGLIAEYQNSQFWYPADALGKAFESAIMTDLGQVGRKPNIFADQDLLMYFSANFSSIKETAFSKVSEFQNLQLPDEWVFSPSNNTRDPLQVHPSVLSALYICQVPRRKAVGDLVISVLIADLVLLTALWKLTMWIATWLAWRKDPQAMWCAGCAVTITPAPLPQNWPAWPQSGYQKLRGKSAGGTATELDDLQSLVSHRGGSHPRTPSRPADGWE